jgi:endonuclease YncB( thermonuclease family)
MPFLILLFAGAIFAKSPLPYPIKMDNAKAIYIVDGDSISLSMRIKGIDTPEKPQKCRKTPDKVINCGTVSKEYLKVLLDNLPGELYINPVEIGYYGRVLVDVYKGGKNIGEMMVENGMAYAYGNRYKEQEAIAKSKKRGFWGYDKPPLNPRTWRKRYGRKF